ncbi:MAG TPA: rhomboid family intramembrane serine protease [Clostridiales bacterium]|nr:rhomboid family intramembrane serine protease [Clostridiales bacterium]
MDDYGNRETDYIEADYEIIGAEKRFKRPNFQIDMRPPYVTYSLIAINIVVWLLMTLIGVIFDIDQSLQLLIFGAKVNELIVRGQYWRLFTAMFLHIGIAHLFFNSYALYIYGRVVEPLFGKIKFLMVYIVSGLMGSLFSYMFSPNPAAGASGAIFGLMGSLLYFRRNYRYIYDRAIGPQLIIVMVINLLYGFIQPGIDNWGHIGGLIGGFLSGSALGLYREKDLKGKRVVFWLIIILIFLFGVVYGQKKYGYMKMI